MADAEDASRAEFGALPELRPCTGLRLHGWRWCIRLTDCMPTGSAMAGLAARHALDSLQTEGRLDCKLVVPSVQSHFKVSLFLLH